MNILQKIYSNKWRLWLVTISAIGAYLRLWNVQSQFLLDDEWHALNFVLERSFPQVIFQHGMGANSIPVNIYSWITLHSIGWSELILRLPSLMAGVAALIVLPVLVKRLWGAQVALVAATLMAVSPILVFYSRVARPYGPVMFLAPASVLLTLLWHREGRRRDLVLAALCGAAATYYHLYALIPVVLPMVVVGLASLPAVACIIAEPVRSPRPSADLVTAACIMVVIGYPLVLLPNLLDPWWAGVQGMDKPNVGTALTVLRLLAGSHLLVLGALFLVLLLWGIRLMAKQSVVESVGMAVPFAVFTVVMATTTQDGAHAGIQAARYGISFFPLAYIAIGIAITRVGSLSATRFSGNLRSYSVLVAGLLVITPAVATSPLWRNYQSPNNFTGHSAFQYRYELRDWSQRSPERDLVPGISMSAENVPKIYRESLAKKYRGIVEYPMLMGDHVNLLYYFQHFHRLPVVVGYFSSMKIPTDPPRRPFVYANMPTDYVLGSVPEACRTGMKWNNMVDMDDMQGLRQKYQKWLLIVHTSPVRELLEGEKEDLPMATEAISYLSTNLGTPLFADQQIAVWEIR